MIVLGAPAAAAAAAPPRPTRPVPVDQLGGIRRAGLMGALLMASGALGAGAAPSPAFDPVLGLRVLGLPARMPTVSLAVVFTGMTLVVLAWLALGLLVRSGPPGALSCRSLVRILVTWALPLALAPPVFSTDVYSYLGQSAVVARGLDPYLVGPAQALGLADPLTRSIPTIWRSTGCPYGPGFLTISHLVPAISGNHVVLGVLMLRMLAVAAVALIVWLLPRLARRVGVDPVVALWLGALNPVVLFHLVSGAHNDGLMAALMLAGIYVGLTRSWLRGAALVGLAATVKLPAALALGFLAAHQARVWGGRPRDVARAAGGVGAIATAVVVAVCQGSGLGFGWIGNLDVPNQARNPLSLSTDLGILAGQVSAAAGLGNHVEAILPLTRAAALLVAAMVCVALLVATLSGRLNPLGGVGVSLGIVAVLSPTLYPWYLIWSLLPLAAAPCSRRTRTAAVALSVLIGIALLPNGAVYAFDQLPMAAAATAVTLVVVIGTALAVVRHPFGPLVAALLVTKVGAPVQPPLGLRAGASAMVPRRGTQVGQPD